jgi:hypothetical protein
MGTVDREITTIDVVDKASCHPCILLIYISSDFFEK